MHSSIAEVEKRQTPCWRSVSIFLLGGWQKEGESETEVTQPTPTPAPPLPPTMIYLWLSLPVNVFSLFELGCAKRKQNSLNRSRRTLPTHWLFRYKFWWPTVEPRYYREYVITEEFVISRFYCLVFFSTDGWTHEWGTSDEFQGRKARIFDGTGTSSTSKDSKGYSVAKTRKDEITSVYN